MLLPLVRAELVCDHATIAASCPYCDNPTVIRSGLQARSGPISLSRSSWRKMRPLLR